MTVTVTNSPSDRLSGEQIAGLFQSIAAGDAEGWEPLVHEFGGMITSIARAHRLCDADIADVVQVTWLRLVEHLDRVNDPVRVGGWLATTARRECLRVIRDSKRQVLLGDAEPDGESPDARPGDGLLIAERDVALRRSLARLTDRDQALLRLLVAERHHDYAEISARLDMPIGSIGPTRARALERLRTHLEHDQALNLLTA